MSKRKRYTAEMKVRILREHLENRVSIPELCEQYEIHPNMLYHWKKQLFEQALSIFPGQHKNGKSRTARRAEKLEAKLTQMREVIAELTEENLKLRKIPLDFQKANSMIGSDVSARPTNTTVMYHGISGSNPGRNSPLSRTKWNIGKKAIAGSPI